MDTLTNEMASASISQPSPNTPTFTPQPDCMLFDKLPGELRNEIIRLSVVEDTEIKPKVIRTCNETTSQWTAKLELDHALMRTCKQLRQESSEIYLLENTFHLTEDFFAQPPLTHVEQQQANERAIHALARAFGPSASKLLKIKVSHAVYYDTRLFESVHRRQCQAEVYFSICRCAQGEPGVYLENARALDTSSQGLCCCSVTQYAADNSTAGIFEFVEGLVGMLDSATEQRSEPHCWTCGLQVMI
jgi:hypothetical protein